MSTPWLPSRQMWINSSNDQPNQVQPPAAHFAQAAGSSFVHPVNLGYLVSIMMTSEDIRTRKLHLFEQLSVRFAKCPECGGKLKQELLSGLASSWTYTMSKYTARTLGWAQNAPHPHPTDVPECKHCPQCSRWYSRGWVYWQSA